MTCGPWNRGSPVTTHLWMSGNTLRVMTTGARAGMSMGTVVVSSDNTLAPFPLFFFSLALAVAACTTSLAWYLHSSSSSSNLDLAQ